MEMVQAKTHPAMQEPEVVNQKALHSNEENEYQKVCEANYAWNKCQILFTRYDLVLAGDFQ